MGRRLRNPRNAQDPVGNAGAEALRAMTEEQIGVLINHLDLLVTKRRLRNIDSADVVIEALTQVLNGQRSLNPSYSLYENLCLIMKSVAYNEIHRKRPEQLPEISIEPSTPIWSASERRSPFDIYEESEDRKTLWKRISLAVNKDKVLKCMVDIAKSLGDWDNDEIAKQLGIEKAVVYNGKRRLQRKLKRLG
jgi:DNA-directed RNA polymerase specialized sigma24 family protein